MKTVLLVRHKGRAKMVGKVFKVRGAPIFYHEEVTPTQGHGTMDSPGGIDLEVLDWLEENGVQGIHHARRGSGEILVAPVAAVRRGRFQESGGRHRMYLARSQWMKARQHYKVPWVEEETIL